ncbi:MAG: hypothetical protein RPU15_00870 [Candidatus Sedimenticola sp. (ex Thyasira tokunagai)]
MDLYNLKNILSLSTEPEQTDAFSHWVQQEDLIPFLVEEIKDENIIIYASLPHVFIHAVLIPEVELNDSSVKDLLQWSHNPFSGWGIACSSDDAWLEGPLTNAGSSILCKGEQIIFGRSFDGDESKRHYFDLDQKIAHVLGVHFVTERNAWCKLDRFGDLEDVVKITELKELPNNETGTIITVKKDVLGEYSSISKFSLLRMFDFTRYKSGSFSGWGDRNEPIEFNGENDIYGSLVISNGYGSYSRGFQVKNISIPKDKVINDMWGRPEPEEPKQYATFIAQDWKNKRIGEISCDPSCLANYFTKSDLPFEITPAFFKPEVLLKYKSDREKYRLESRSVGCRSAWHLKTFDINDAGQVHTYLIYLSNLPYEEQLHWKQYNEKPKAPLSERAITTDFEGQFHDGYDPLPSLKRKLEKLNSKRVGWWTLRDQNAPNKVHYPYTASRDEWADEILNLDQLVVEGLEEKWLRNKAKELGRNPDIKLRGLKLTEECLVAVGFDDDHAHQLMSPFHEIHNLRSILKGHASGREAEKIRKESLQKFGSFRQHFEYLCSECDNSLETIIEAFKEF